MIGQAKSVLTILVLQMMANQLGTRTKSAPNNSCWMAKRRGGKGTWKKRWFCSNKRSSFTRATNFVRGSKNSRYSVIRLHPPPQTYSALLCRRIKSKIVLIYLPTYIESQSVAYLFLQSIIQEYKAVVEEDEEDEDGLVEVGNGFRLAKEIYEALYDYQKDTLLWLWGLFNQRKGGILGDDMGLVTTTTTTTAFFTLQYTLYSGFVFGDIAL